MTAVQVLIKARQNIRIHGWAQAVSVAPDGRICAGQAIAMAAARQADDIGQAVWLMMQIIHEQDGPGYCSIPQWNDMPRRTVGEVFAMFDRAIEYGRAEAKIPVLSPWNAGLGADITFDNTVPPVEPPTAALVTLKTKVEELVGV